MFKISDWKEQNLLSSIWGLQDNALIRGHFYHKPCDESHGPPREERLLNFGSVIKPGIPLLTAIFRISTFSITVFWVFLAFWIFWVFRIPISPVNSFVNCCMLPWSMDQMKGAVESYLQGPVIWWPWEPRILPVHRRVYWNCVMRTTHIYFQDILILVLIHY